MEYTPIRRFYAITGFITLLILGILAVSAVFIPSVTVYNIHDEKPLTIENRDFKEVQIWVHIDAEVSAYSSSKDETWGDPFTTAS